MERVCSLVPSGGGQNSVDCDKVDEMPTVDFKLAGKVCAADATFFLCRILVLYVLLLLLVWLLQEQSCVLAEVPAGPEGLHTGD